MERLTYLFNSSNPHIVILTEDELNDKIYIALEFKSTDLMEVFAEQKTSGKEWL